jgi:hypothetical protein
MLIGFNNDVEFKGKMYHIQTEDHGIKDGQITTIIFFSGQILDSNKISYLADLKGIEDEEEKKKIIKKHMVELHRNFYKRLFDGDYEEHVDKLIIKEQGKAPPARVSSGNGAKPPAPAEQSSLGADASSPGKKDKKPMGRPSPPPIPKRTPGRAPHRAHRRPGRAGR